MDLAMRVIVREEIAGSHHSDELRCPGCRLPHMKNGVYDSGWSLRAYKVLGLYEKLLGSLPFGSCHSISCLKAS